MTFPRKFLREVAGLRLPAGAVGAPVTGRDLAGLPEPAQRYLRFMGVVGRPRDWSFRVAWTGRFRTSARDPWVPCSAWQYNHGPAVTRIFHIRARLRRVIPVLARDTYASGQGRMLIRLLDLVTVEDGKGEAFDVGELVTYLNDAVLIAPSMLLVPAVSWFAVDAASFDVAIADAGRTVRGRVFLDDRGAPVNFSTTDRYYHDVRSPTPVRTAWTTPVEGWQDVGGRPLWTRVRAVWHPPWGEFAYADVVRVPESLAFNVRPVI